MTERQVVIGVTGNIACGKSTVMRHLGDLGAELIDADRVYHQLIEPEKPLWESLRQHFGDAIIRDDRTIDRRELGQIVFNDREKLRELERMTQPAVRTEIVRRLELSDSAVIAIDAVKLIESKLSDRCDRVWVVICEPALQFKRLMERNGFSYEEAMARIDAQPPIEPKLAVADEIIDNSGSDDETRTQVEAAWRRALDFVRHVDSTLSV